MGIDRVQQQFDSAPGRVPVIRTGRRDIDTRMPECEGEAGFELRAGVRSVHLQPGSRHAAAVEQPAERGQQGCLAEPARRPEYRDRVVRRHEPIQQGGPVEVVGDRIRHGRTPVQDPVLDGPGNAAAVVRSHLRILCREFLT